MPNGRVLIAGGDRKGVALKTVELFSPAARAFARAGVLPTARKQHAAAALPDGHVVIAGGANESAAALSSMDVFDSATGSVSAGASLLTPRAGLTATTLANGDVLFVGGNNGLADLASSEILDHATGMVSPVAGNPDRAPGSHCPAALQDGPRDDRGRHVVGRSR